MTKEYTATRTPLILRSRSGIVKELQIDMFKGIVYVKEDGKYNMIAAFINFEDAKIFALEMNQREKQVS